MNPRFFRHTEQGQYSWGMLPAALLLASPAFVAQGASPPVAQDPSPLVRDWSARLEALARDDHRDGTFGPTGKRLWVTRLEATPGLRGQAHYIHHTPDLADPLAVAFLDAEGREVPLEVTGETWRPSDSTVRYRAEKAEVVEERWITLDDVYVDRFTIRGPARWTLRASSRLTPLPGGDLSRFTPFPLARFAGVDVLAGKEMRRGEAGDPVWIEGERPGRQRGSSGRDRKAAASGGEVLGSNFGGEEGHEAAWEFLSSGEGEWTLWLRYARADAGPARWQLLLRGAPHAEVVCDGTGGWGGKEAELRFVKVELGQLPAGLCELGLRALHGRANTNFDGLLVARKGSEPPPAATWRELDPLRGGVFLEGGVMHEEGVPFQVVPAGHAQGALGAAVPVRGSGNRVHVLVVPLAADARVWVGERAVPCGGRRAPRAVSAVVPEAEVLVRGERAVVVGITREDEGKAAGAGRRGNAVWHGVPTGLLLTCDAPDPIEVPAGERRVVHVALEWSGGRLPGEATAAALRGPDALARHREEYVGWFARNCPRFSCSDPLLAQLWTYRCFLLRHNLSWPQAGYLSDGPVFYEGRHGGWYPRVITFSTPHIVAEARWLLDPALWSGNVRAHLRNQQADGVLPNVLCHERGFRYTHWIGAATVEALQVHPDRALAAQVLPGLVRNVEGKLRDFDQDQDGALCPGDHYTTGMEFQPSFWFHAGYDDSKPQVDLERPDFTSYVYGSARALGELARWLGEAGPGSKMDAAAQRAREGALRKLWHEQDHFFYSIRAADDDPALTKEIIGFYPFRFLLPPDEPRFTKALDLLVDPRHFWTAFPVASCSRQVPVYSAAVQKWPGPGGVVTACMWNGPTWPHANSQAADVIAAAVRSYHGHRLTGADLGELLRRFARFHCEGGDPRRPLLREYGDGETGVNWGCPDYLHSTWLDLLVRHALGLVPRFDDSLELRPLELGLGDFEFADVPYHGRRLGARIHGGRLTVTIDGVVAGTGRVADGMFLGGGLR
jgi:hypothetical protein